MKTTRHSFFPSLNFSSIFSRLPLSSLLLTFLTLFVASVATAQVPSYVPTNGLVGYWPFNGNANDESGNGNNGTVNGATLTADYNGIANSAYGFNSDAHIFVPFSSSINSIQNGITMSAWIYMDGGTGSGTPPRVLELRGAYGNGGDAGFVILSEGNSNTSRTLYVRWFNNFGNTNISVSPTISLNSLSWHHIAFTCDGQTGTGNFYLDGLLVNTNSTQAGQGTITSCNYNNNGLFIGAEPNLLGKWGGNLDDMALYNRALNSSEVLSLFNGCNVSPVAIVGSNTPIAYATSTYTCNSTAGSTYTWTVNNGVIVSGQGTNSVTVLWGAEGVGSVSVLETTADGCVGDEVIYDVNVQCVVSGNAITGPVGPEAFSNSTYTCNGAANSTYNWTVTNGVIASGQGTNTVTILWASTGLGNVSVVETTAEGCLGTTLSQDVVVVPVNVEELSNQMLLYPNPATTELNLQTTTDLIGTDLFVFDALGKQILKQQILSTNTIINTSSFAAGNYVVKVGGGVKKFTVEK